MVYVETLPLSEQTKLIVIDEGWLFLIKNMRFEIIYL